MNEQLAVQGPESAPQSSSSVRNRVDPEAQPESQGAIASGVFAKGRRDGGGWGLVLVSLQSEPVTISLTDGAVAGSASRDAKIEGPGVATEHVRAVSYTHLTLPTILRV